MPQLAPRPGVSVSFGGGSPVPVADYTFDAGPIEYVRSLYATLPDPGWEVVDGHGHVHRWALTGRDEYHRPEALPTLIASSRHVPCDGSCGGVCGGEGYDVTVWHCRVCGEEVRPGFVPDHQARGRGVPIRTGPPTASLVIEGVPPQLADTPLAVTVRLRDREMAGRGWVVERRWDSDGRQSYTVEAALLADSQPMT